MTAARAILKERAADWYAPAHLAITKMEDPRESEDAEAALRHAEAAPLDMGHNGSARKLNRYGLGAVARVLSAKNAIGNKEFVNFAGKVWVPEFGPQRLAELAEVWYQMPPPLRRAIVEAVLSDTPAVAIRSDTRDALIDLGLSHWLSR
jgi:hypothetical protein